MLLSRVIADRVHPEDRAGVKARIAAARETGEYPPSEFRVVHRDGSVHVDPRSRRAWSATRTARPCGSWATSRTSPDSGPPRQRSSGSRGSSRAPTLARAGVLAAPVRGCHTLSCSSQRRVRRLPCTMSISPPSRLHWPPVAYPTPPIVRAPRHALSALLRHERVHDACLRLAGVAQGHRAP